MILRGLGKYFGVRWRKLRPTDRLAQELDIPSSRLHELMVSDFLSSIEYLIEERTGLEPDSLPEASFDIWDWSIQDLITHVLFLLSLSSPPEVP